MEDTIFDERNIYKKQISHTGANTHYNDLYINSGEIRYITLGKNIGTEIDGKTNFRRPVLIIKKLGSLFLCIPLTTKIKTTIYHYILHSGSGYQPSSIILSQIRTIDKKRFLYRLGAISNFELQKIKKHLQYFYF